jgi:hypothetical protein
MDCAKSLSLLSEYRIGSLDETESTGVRSHLDGCPPCCGVFDDLNSIVQAAEILRTAEEVPPGVSFPDEDLVWQRMGLGGKTLH